MRRYFLLPPLLAACLILLTVLGAGAADDNPARLAAGGAAPAGRIVSLAPSNTELIYSLGAQDRLLAVSTYCDYPGEARQKEKAGSFVSANLERLARLKPDLIVLVSGQEFMAGMLRHHGFRVVVLDNNRLAQIPANLRALGNLTGKAARADELARSCERSLSRLTAMVAGAPGRPRLFYCVWPQPLLTAGGQSFLNDVITACGGTNVAGALAAAYPHFSIEKLLVSQPEIVIMPGEARGKSFLRQPPWSSLAARKTGHFYFLPAGSRDCLARPTLRVFEGLYWLASRVHPELSAQLDAWRKEAPR